MLGGRDPVGVDRLHMVGVGLAAPADEEALGGAGAPVDVGLRDGRAPDAARRLRHEAEGHDRRAREVLARLLVGDVDELLEAPLRGQRRQGALHVDARVARADRSGCGIAGGRPGSKVAVDQQAPDLLEGDRADELLDVDAAVAQRAALPVGLGDLGGEGDDALQAGLDFGHVGAHVASTGSGSGVSRARSARACDAVVLLALQRGEHGKGRQRRQREHGVGGGPRGRLDQHAEGAGRATPPTEISVFCRLIAVPARARPEISAAAVKARPFQLIVEMAAKASSGYRRTPGPVASAPTRGQQRGVARGDAAHRGDAQALAIRAPAGDDAHERADDLQHAQRGRRARRADVARVVQEEDDEAEHRGLARRRAARRRRPGARGVRRASAAAWRAPGAGRAPAEGRA